MRVISRAAYKHGISQLNLTFAGHIVKSVFKRNASLFTVSVHCNKPSFNFFTHAAN